MIKKYIMGVLFIIFAILLFITPFGILMSIRHDEWVTEADGVSIAVGVLIGAGYMFLVFKGALKRIAPLFSLLLTSIIFYLITLFLDTIINDLSWIMLSVSIGLSLFIVFFKIGNRMIEKAKIYGDEKMRIVARQDAQADLNAII